MENTDTLNLEEFINKYGNKLKQESISDNIKSEAIDVILYEKEKREEQYKFYIKNIYWAIVHINMSIKFNEKIDIDTISLLINNILYLNNDINIKYNNFYNLEKLCNDIYNDIYSQYSEYIDDNILDKFNYNNITNIYYYIDWIKDNINDQNIIDELNILWRYL